MKKNTHETNLEPYLANLIYKGEYMIVVHETTGKIGISFIIWGNPTTKKNSQRIIWKGKSGNRKPFIVPSKKYEEYEKASLLYCPPLHINSAVNVKAIYYRQDHRRVDLTNLNEALHDILVKAGTLEDDNCNIIVSTDGSRVMYDKDYPRTEVYIEDI